jgi:MGT family glycosyltransferase
VNPVLGIVTELVARGHRVSYATTPDFAARVAQAGASPVLYHSTLPSDSDPTTTWPEDLGEGLLLSLQESIATLPEIEAAFRHDRPDLVLSEDTMGAGRVMAAKWGIPAIQVWPFFAVNEHWSWWTHVDQSASTRVQRHRTMTAFLDSQGLGSVKDYFAANLDGGIVLMPRTFQYRGETFSERFAFVGPCLTERAFQGSWQAPTGERPVLYISLGTVHSRRPEFYRACFDAFADLPWHVVMAVGHFIEPSSLGEPAANFQVHPRVPQLSVLSQASVFVTHAGMNSTMESLYYGVPMVAIPQMVEQEHNARRVEELGLGRLVAREEATATHLREAVLSIAADKGMPERLHAMRAASRGAGGAPAAADFVEASLRRCCALTCHAGSA